MDTVDKHLTALGKYPNNFDALSQQFVGGSFYGLEYVLEDFFQHTQLKPPEDVRANIDWFGLYNC